MPKRIAAFLSQTGYGEVADVLSFRSEWAKQMEVGERAGRVIFAQDDCGNCFAASIANGQIHFLFQSISAYALKNPAMSAALVPRPQCTACLRPLSACICRWVAPTAHEVEVLVLQHPLEVHQAKGSARLLHLSLAHCRLVVGEAFAVPVWPMDGKHTLLLYPDSLQDSPPDLRIPPPLPPEWPQAKSRLRLIVLDGTWRKSRKMLYQSPPLQQLPRLALRNLPPSHYRIRKAHGPDQLSTLEATCHALGQLEGDAARFRPLLDAFDGFVEHLAQVGGRRNAQTEEPRPRPSVTGFV